MKSDTVPAHIRGKFMRTARAVLRKPYYWTLFRVSRGVAGVRVREWSAQFRVASVQELMRANGMRGERGQVARFLGLLQPDDVIWDIGANIGTYAVFSAIASGPEARVFAFEPESSSATRLEENAALNRLENLTVVRVALSDGDQGGVLRVNRTPGRGNHTLESAHGRNEVHIATQTGDALVGGGMPPPTVVKLDVEGHEDRVLIGMADTLAAGSIRLFFCEVHRTMLRSKGVDPESIRITLEKAGLTLMEQSERGDELHVLAEKRG